MQGDVIWSFIAKLPACLGVRVAQHERDKTSENFMFAFQHKGSGHRPWQYGIAQAFAGSSVVHDLRVSAVSCDHAQE